MQDCAYLTSSLLSPNADWPTDLQDRRFGRALRTCCKYADCRVYNVRDFHNSIVVVGVADRGLSADRGSSESTRPKPEALLLGPSNPEVDQIYITCRRSSTFGPLVELAVLCALHEYVVVPSEGLHLRCDSLAKPVDKLVSSLVTTCKEVCHSHVVPIILNGPVNT